MSLKEDQIIALSLAQLDDVTRRVEHHGVELGMLLDGLMSLIGRHERESRAAGEGPGKLTAQLARDHETMLRFEGPLLLARQFHDRLRQRLEHIRAALAEIPAAKTIGEEHREHVERLFPFEEERATSAAAFHLEHSPAEEPDVEMF